MDRFAKQEIAIRYWLLGKGYHVALRAMDFAAGYHTGFRKDGVTPEFSHQIEIVQHIRTLHDTLLFPQETLAVGFLHDVREDYGVADSEIRALFGDRIADGTEAMTKKFRGASKLREVYFAALAASPEGSIAKLVDRHHNFGSMVGVFTVPKQKSYLDEGDADFLPLAKLARRRFPEQEAAYENLKLSLSTQMKLIRAIHAAAEAGITEAA